MTHEATCAECGEVVEGDSYGDVYTEMAAHRWAFHGVDRRSTEREAS